MSRIFISHSSANNIEAVAVILGASGAGKSSFLRAGLVPRIRRDDQNFLLLPVLRPERAAINGESGLVRSLETAMQAQSLGQPRADIKIAIGGGAPTLLPLLAKLADKARPPRLSGEPEGKPPSVVLPIDQGEVRCSPTSRPAAAGMRCHCSRSQWSGSTSNTAAEAV